MAFIQYTYLLTTDLKKNLAVGGKTSAFNQLRNPSNPGSANPRDTP